MVKDLLTNSTHLIRCGLIKEQILYEESQTKASLSKEDITSTIINLIAK